MRINIRPLLFWLCAALILAAFQFMILNKERVKSSGIPLLLELAPVDPRSLMQGDYMRLAYALEADAHDQGQRSEMSGKGFILVRPDAHNVARFVALADAPRAEDMEADTSLLAIPCVFDTYGRPRIQPNSFFFQEGLANHYEQARYALFRCTREGECVLADLADAAGNPLKGTLGKP